MLVITLKRHSSTIVTQFCKEYHQNPSSPLPFSVEFFCEKAEFCLWKKMVFIHKWQVHMKMLCYYVVRSNVTSEAKLWFAIFHHHSYICFLVCFIEIQNILVIFDQKLLFATQPKSIYWNSSCCISTDSLGIKTQGCSGEISNREWFTLLTLF